MWGPARTALLGSRTENEPNSELSSEFPAKTGVLVVSANSQVELNDGTSAVSYTHLTLPTKA